MFSLLRSLSLWVRFAVGFVGVVGRFGSGGCAAGVWCFLRCSLRFRCSVGCSSSRWCFLRLCFCVLVGCACFAVSGVVVRLLARFCWSRSVCVPPRSVVCPLGAWSSLFFSLRCAFGFGGCGFAAALCFGLRCHLVVVVVVAFLFVSGLLAWRSAVGALRGSVHCCWWRAAFAGARLLRAAGRRARSIAAAAAARAAARVRLGCGARFIGVLAWFAVRRCGLFCGVCSLDVRCALRLCCAWLAAPAITFSTSSSVARSRCCFARCCLCGVCSFRLACCLACRCRRSLVLLGRLCCLSISALALFVVIAVVFFSILRCYVFLRCRFAAGFGDRLVHCSLRSSLRSFLLFAALRCSVVRDFCFSACAVLRLRFASCAARCYFVPGVLFATFLLRSVSVFRFLSRCSAVLPVSFLSVLAFAPALRPSLLRCRPSLRLPAPRLPPDN